MSLASTAGANEPARRGKATAEEMRAAKGIGWSFDHLGLRDALPPAYTETIGRQLMAATRR